MQTKPKIELLKKIKTNKQNNYINDNKQRNPWSIRFGPNQL